MRITTCFLALIIVVASAIASDSGRNDSYILHDGDVTYMLGEGMSAAALKRIEAQYGSEFLWARRGGQIFVTHDATLIDRARGAVQRGTRAEQERTLATIADAAMRRK